ncbi:MAG: acetyl-CoA decarbonylase/synthase complex subunit delta [Oscillospiraceae bacterium]|nr:acetyl-CoA decarbonylase/synthase complex subunit delta [Oscillospiraceae bacterium]
MAYKNEAQVFPSSINTLTIGIGDKAIAFGGENVLPLYTFDAPIEHRPKIGVAISDMGYIKGVPGIEKFYAGAENVIEMAKLAANMPGADFLVLCLDSANPNNGDKSIEECVDLVKKVLEAVDIPVAVEGCKNIEKDSRLLEKVAEAAQEGSDKNILILSAHEENYKAVATAAALAYGQNVTAESAVDINLAKQLNVLINVLGISPEKMMMNLGSAAAGYGFEYIASTIERVKMAALAQDDAMLKMPIITPVSSETWAVKESLASQEDYPEWGSAEARGVNMEVSTAAACLAAGSNAVILAHPDSVKTISELIDNLM